MKRFIFFALSCFSALCLPTDAIEVGATGSHGGGPLDDGAKNDIGIHIKDGNVQSEDGYLWGNEDDNGHWSGRLHYEYGPEREVSIGKNEDGFGIGLEGKWHNIDSFIIESPEFGNEYLNVKNEFEVGIKEEADAELDLLRISKNGDEIELNVAKAEIGAAITAFAKWTAETNILFIPVTVEAEGGLSAGAKAGAEAGLSFNMETGELTLNLGASVVWGYGGEGNVQISVGILQGVNNLIVRITSGDTDRESDTGRNGDDMVCKPGDNPDDPFNSDPQNQGGNTGNGPSNGSGGKNDGYQGLKPIHLF